MSEQDTEQLKRTYAKGRFTRFVNDLADAIDGNSFEPDTAKSMYEDVKDAWKNVIEKQKNYSSAAGKNEVDGAELWINEEQTKYNTIRKRYNIARLQHDSNVREGNARRSRDVSYGEFIHLCENVSKLIGKRCSVVAIERERSHIKQQFQEVKRHNTELLMVSDDDIKTEVSSAEASVPDVDTRT